VFKKTAEDAERFGKRAGKAAFFAFVFGKTRAQTSAIGFFNFEVPNSNQTITKARVLRVFSTAEMATATAHGEPLNPPNPT
jgi:hypothetical protein